MDLFRQPRLHWADYLVFAAMMCVSLGIGIYQALVARKKASTSDYFLGGRSMGLVPVTLSLVVTYVSTITLLGYPAEMYAFGVQYYLFTLGILLGIAVCTGVFVPLFYPLKITSVNEYLYLRYDSRLVQYIGTITSVGNYAFYLGNVYYGPAVAVEAVSGFPTLGSVLIIGVVSIVYTSIGGFKAVIWTDVFQCMIMLAGMIAVVVQAVITVGGFENVWRVNKEWGRLNFFDFDPDPMKRMNFYGAVFGNALTVVAVYGYWQTGVQRYMSMPTMAKARWCLMGMVPGNILMQTLAFLCGVTMFAYYAKVGCDPKQLDYITSYNQLMPYFVSSIFDFPVIPGLFLAALYAASLSTASTVLNASAACIWTDMLEHMLPKVTPMTASLICKATTILLGIFGVCIAMGISAMEGGTLVQIISLFGSSVGGPNFALFLLGAFFPWVNVKGVTIASIIGFAFGMWISVGNYLYAPSWTALPAPADNCSLYVNLTAAVTTAMPDVYNVTAAVVTAPTGIYRLYSISFLWMREVITGFTVVLAIIFSALTGFRKSDTVEAQFMHPVMRYCFRLKENEYRPVSTEDTTATDDTPMDSLSAKEKDYYPDVTRT